jgi:hypothetical protein
MSVVQLHWDTTPFFANATKIVNAKFRQVRAGLKHWSKELSKLGKLINNSHFVLTILDGLEEQRLLSSLESSFRRLVKQYLAKLQEAKRLYWKQRNTARWVLFGDKNTRLFHTMATYSMRRNFISSLTFEDGSEVFEYEQKAGVLWSAYRDMLGVSKFSGILFELSELIPLADLPVLDGPFSMEEITTVLKDMPSDHAPGPDGFNGAFFKRCWPIIKNDILRLCKDFADGNLNLESINVSLTTLIPKKDNLRTVNDFRLISLLNYSLKFLTKLLSNRLQTVILKVVHANQY